MQTYLNSSIVIRHCGLWKDRVPGRSSNQRERSRRDVYGGELASVQQPRQRRIGRKAALHCRHSPADYEITIIENIATSDLAILLQGRRQRLRGDIEIQNNVFGEGDLYREGNTEDKNQHAA